MLNKKPNFLACCRLKCPYCLAEPLLKEKSFFTFRPHCPTCKYRLEREEGYYTAGSWMINFPFTATLSFILAAFLMIKFPNLDALIIASITSVFLIALGLIMT